jgi:hypothetical protein
MSAHESRAGYGPNGKAPPALPAHVQPLMARFEEMAAGNAGAHQLFEKPWDANDSTTGRLQDATGYLHRNKWQVGDAIALILHGFPNGIASNSVVPLEKNAREFWTVCDEAEKKAVATASNRKAFFDPWEDPPQPEWPGGVLSRRTEETLAAISLRDGVDYAAQSIAYICAASGAAPKDARFTPYQDGDWTVPPIFWVMMIAESAQRKTAIVKNAFSELKRIHGIRWSEYNQELAQWNALAEKEKREKGKPIEPHSFIVSDFTVEKLQQILAANSRGTMLLKDEIAAIFDFGRYAHRRRRNRAGVLPGSL